MAPACVKSGEKLNDPVPSPLSANVALEGRVEVERVGIVASASVAVTPNASVPPSLMLRGPIGSSTGGAVCAPATEARTISSPIARSSLIVMPTILLNHSLQEEHLPGLAL